MSLKVYSKAHKKEVTVTAMIDPDKITYGSASDTTLKYKVGSGAPAAYKGHNGLDIAGSDGSPIYSIYDGVVRVNKYESGGAGYYVSIGTDMNGKNIRVMYMHLKAKSKLKKGAKIKAGDLVGYQGSTGHSTGSHLHITYAVANKSSDERGKVADPYDYVIGEPEEVKNENKVFVTGTWKLLSTMNIRTGPGTSYEITDTIPKGAIVGVVGVSSNGWGMTADGKWFCLDDGSTVYAERIGDSFQDEAEQEAEPEPELISDLLKKEVGEIK